MRLFLYSFLLTCSLAAGAHAATFEQQLLKLDFEERADQVCVMLGVETIRREGRLPNADRLMTSASGRAVVKGSVVVASHAAVRANNHWYSLKFNCAVSDDHIKALSFKYEIGAEIPRAEWENYGLWQH